MADKNRLTGPLAELLLSQREEIAKYKWIESEKTGQGIGWDQASAAWFQHHFADWVRDQRRAIDQALMESVAPMSKRRLQESTEKLVTV